MPDFPTTELLSRYWRSQVIGTVDHVEVNERVHEDAGWNARYLFMTTMSAGIAMLGLLLSSPAVVIGAMLISPLMGPIVGLGFALATVDAKQIRRAAAALAAGSLFAVLFAAALVLVSPLQNVTAELAARTRPNLFDLVIALFSALAGTYATIRGRHGTIVGVAIATALMPPLATVGFGLATWNWPVFAGALLLFVTNFVTIALAAAVMARLYGFGPKLSPNQTALQFALVMATTAALAVPLGLSLRQLAWEGLATNAARQTIGDVFTSAARISQVDIDFAREPIDLEATVLTPNYRGDANRVVTQALERRLRRRIHVEIRQYRVGTGEDDADAATIQSASRGRTDGIEQGAEAVAQQLALVAGVDRADVIVDRVGRIARATARPLPGAGIATYRALEARAASDGWTIVLVPPPTAPAPIPADGDTPDPLALADVGWAARRLGYGVRVSGSDAQAAAAIAGLEREGVAATRGEGTGPAGGIGVAWALPAAAAP